MDIYPILKKLGICNNEKYKNIYFLEHKDGSFIFKRDGIELKIKQHRKISIVSVCIDGHTKHVPLYMLACHCFIPLEDSIENPIPTTRKDVGYDKFTLEDLVWTSSSGFLNGEDCLFSDESWEKLPKNKKSLYLSKFSSEEIYAKYLEKNGISDYKTLESSKMGDAIKQYCYKKGFKFPFKERHNYSSLNDQKTIQDFITERGFRNVTELKKKHSALYSKLCGLGLASKIVYPNKNYSTGELVIKDILDSAGISYIYDSTVPFLEGQRLDFRIDDYSLVIEYHGEQHFKGGSQFFTKTWENQYNSDLKKYENCVKNGYDVIYVIFPEITTSFNKLDISNYINTVYTSINDLKSFLTTRTGITFNKSEKEIKTAFKKKRKKTYTEHKKKLDRSKVTKDMVQKYIDDNNIKNSSELLRRNPSYYYKSSKRKFLTSLNFSNRRNDFKDLTVQDVQSIINDNNIKCPTDLRKFNNSLYSIVYQKRLSESLIYPNKQNSWSHLKTVEDFQEFVDDNKIVGFKDFCKKFGGVYNRAKRLKITRKLKFTRENENNPNI